MYTRFPPKLKRRLTKHKTAVRAFITALFLGVFIFSLYIALPPTFTLLKSLARGPAAAFSLVKDPSGVLRSTKSRTNLVLLGMGGANHKGPQLTDSMLVVSIDLSSADVVLLSIPRDVWIDSLQTKINATYYYGQQKKEGGGIILTKSAIEEIIGQPIHYALAIDFDGFKRAVDLVGGIEIEVAESFDDYKYPVPGMEDAEPEGLRYEHLHFDSGLQSFNGEIALKYVRSRYAEGEEGTDFARSKRQQQVLKAFRNQVLSLETILSPAKVKELFTTFSSSIKTDLSETEYLSLIKLAVQAKNNTFRSGILEEEKENNQPGLLTHPSPENYGGQWVLVGKNDSWNQVHEYVENLFYQQGIN